jgi:hypothetical protein
MKHRRLFCAVLLSIAAALANPTAGLADPAPPPVVVVDNHTGLGGDFSFGSKGGASSPNSGGGSGAEPATVTGPYCVPVPVAGAGPMVIPDPAGGGPIPGVLMVWECHSPDGSVIRPTAFVAPAGPAVAPPPDPAVVAAEAYNLIRFPVPTPHLSPYVRIAVNYWNYLHVDDPGPLSASASAAGLTVTATARLASSTWSMGEVANLHTAVRVAAFSCRGGGEKPGPDPEWNVARPASTDCAYAYQWQSLRDRTGGAGTWPVTVSTTWDISWTATNGVSGTATRTQTSAPTRVAVGEWRTVVVAGDEQIEGNGGG